MRYDNWDVILFPEDSSIPIPEYRTACYLSRDEDGHELPTLRTYIGSLKPETPFRVSLHHWGLPKPSPLIQAVQRKAGMNITFVVRVIVDGFTLYHGSFETDNTSPQEIAYEQRSFKSSRTKEQPSSQAKKPLLFPRNDKNALLQSSTWQPRGTDNRIKVILSEQLVSVDDSLAAEQWEIVCFSFQHAPRDLLEQGGIAYPIADPLRALMAERAALTAQSSSRNSMAREPQRGSRTHPGVSPESDSELARPVNPGPHQQPNRMPSMSQCPPPLMGHRGVGHPGLWYTAYDYDNASMRSFSSQRYVSNMSGLEGIYDPSFGPHGVPPCAYNTTMSEQLVEPVMHSKRPRNDNHAQQVMMSLRDDQFGQIIEALSPSKAERNKPNGLTAHTQSHRPPRMGALSVPVRPSSAARTRTNLDANYTLRTQRPSSDKANFDVRATAKHISKRENRCPREEISTQLMVAPQRWDSDVSMKDGSSNVSSISRFEKDSNGLGYKNGSAHAPAGIKSRKEGLPTDTDDSLDLLIRHDQTVTDLDRTPSNSHVEIIDIDAIDPSLTTDLEKLSPFKPSHKAGMSSVSSTGRLERQLYSALGEELGSFEPMSAGEMGPELAKALTACSHSDLSGSTMLDSSNDSEPTKRKRQGTLGGMRDKSPTKKKERQAIVEDEDIPDDMPRLRGD